VAWRLRKFGHEVCPVVSKRQPKSQALLLASYNGTRDTDLMRIRLETQQDSMPLSDVQGCAVDIE